jgi:hypothetical protein
MIEFLNAWKEVIALVVFALMALNAEAKGAIAVTNEIMQKSNMTDEAALELAAMLMGRIKLLGLIPLSIRKWIIQTTFNAIKQLASKKAQ